MLRMDDKIMAKSITDWKQLGKKVRTKPRKIRMDYLLDDKKIMRMTNWMKNTKKRRKNKSLAYAFGKKLKP